MTLFGGVIPITGITFLMFCIFSIYITNIITRNISIHTCSRQIPRGGIAKSEGRQILRLQAALSQIASCTKAR